MKKLRLIIDMHVDDNVQPADIEIQGGKEHFTLLPSDDVDPDIQAFHEAEIVMISEVKIRKDKHLYKVPNLPGEVWKSMEESGYHMISNKSRIKVMARVVPTKKGVRNMPEALVAAEQKTKSNPDKYARVVWYDDKNKRHCIDMNVRKAMTKYFGK